MVLGGLGKLRMTSFASCDLFTMTSLSLTAVCMRRTLEDSFLKVNTALGKSERLMNNHHYWPFSLRNLKRRAALSDVRILRKRRHFVKKTSRVKISHLVLLMCDCAVLTLPSSNLTLEGDLAVSAAGVGVDNVDSARLFSINVSTWRRSNAKSNRELQLAKSRERRPKKKRWVSAPPIF